MATICVILRIHLLLMAFPLQMRRVAILPATFFFDFIIIIFQSQAPRSKARPHHPPLTMNALEQATRASADTARVLRGVTPPSGSLLVGCATRAFLSRLWLSPRPVGRPLLPSLVNTRTSCASEDGFSAHISLEIEAILRPFILTMGPALQQS